jgi:steroid delta-isomerase-like uncharacterized protein
LGWRLTNGRPHTGDNTSWQPPREEGTAMDLASAFVGAWNAHDAARVTALYADGYEGQDVGLAGIQHGPEGVRAALYGYLAAFPDFRLMPDDLVVQDDRIAVFWTAAGTHRGPLLHIPPTGRSVTLRGCSYLIVREDRIVRGLHLWDVAGLLRTLGLLPEL